MEGNRAESFLRLIRQSQRGKLKIYLGYAAGVGKTCQMLLEAHRIKDDGVDVVVGLIETHGRAKTMELTSGLEAVSRSKITYRGIVIEEMDLNAILTRRPSVVLIDELAHTNVPGSKNAKRYQDVEEVLAAGIHVISTLNIQHLESLYETVERATGVKVRERIPDHVVAEADQIVNVDVSTEDLRRRLKDGKVYTKDRIETALDHFFRPANLEQLRELTLRELAAQIDSRQRNPDTEELSSSPDQVMVCLSSRGPNSGALLRYASRLAGRLNRNWYAVYVQTSKERPTVIDTTTQRLIANTLTLAQQLGATVFTYKGDDVVKTILQFAREYRVGHVVIGATGRKLPFWKRLMGEVSIVERLVTENSGLTIVVLDTRTMSEIQQTVEVLPSSPEEAVDEAADRIEEKPPQGSGNAFAGFPAIIWDEVIEKEEAARRLVEICFSDNLVLKDLAWQSFIEREQLGGTFVGNDVAIPHARVPGLKQPVVALGISKAGIEDRKSGNCVKIMFLLFSPAGSPESHLEMLSNICRLARDDQWRNMVINSKSVSEIKNLL